MGNDQDDLDIVKCFLRRFYLREPDDLQAALVALDALTDQQQYKWKLANAFEGVLRSMLPPEALANFVREHADRPVLDDEEARQFLLRTYDLNALTATIDVDSYRQHGSH